MTVSLQNKWLFLGTIMGDPKLPASAKLAAYFLLDHLNTRTERCDPSEVGLAERMGMTERTVIRAIDCLEESSYFRVRRSRGRGHRNSYQPNWEKVTPVSPFKTEEKVTFETVKGDISRQEKVTPVSPEAGNRNREEAGKGNPPSEEHDSAPGAASKKYAIEGEVVRLTVENFSEWADLYHGIPDLMTKLKTIDGWCVKNWPAGGAKRRNWYQAVSGWLERDHQELLAAKPKDPAADYWAGIERGEI